MEGNNIKSFENLCKIFEMRIKLDKEKKVKTPSDVLINYEKYAKKIDNIYNEEFEKEIRNLIAPSITIEEEKQRLEKLIKLLEDRLEKRVDLEDRYYLTTGDYISGLQIIISDKELDEKKKRLSLINKYLETTEEIEDVKSNISKLRDLLNEEEEKKEEYNTKNQLLEEELYSEFMKIIKEDTAYVNLTEDNVSEELDNIKIMVKESKETLEVTRDSVKSLITNGLEEDYTSYVEEAEKGYFVIKNKEIYLKLYKIVSAFEDDFNNIFIKRDNISSLLKERKLLIEDLSITDIDDLLSFEKKLLNQLDIMNKEKVVLENISNYTSRIEFKESRLEELEDSNNSVEILAILREFNLIDTYEPDDYEDNEEQLEEKEVTTLEKEEENIIKEVIDPYRIKEIKEAPLTLNLGLAKLKGEAVREKVNKKLNPKPISFDDILTSKTEEIIPEDEIKPLEVEKEEKTFEIEENVLEVKEEENTPQTNEEEIIPEVKEEPKESTPLWEIPSLEDIKPITNPVEMPVWNIPLVNEEDNMDSTKPLPIWDNMPSQVEEEVKEELPSFEKPSENIPVVEPAFWTPVSNDKLESSSFPNLNIPINGLSSDDNFGFPDLN